MGAVVKINLRNIIVIYVSLDWLSDFPWDFPFPGGNKGWEGWKHGDASHPALPPLSQQKVWPLRLQLATGSLCHCTWLLYSANPFSVIVPLWWRSHLGVKNTGSPKRNCARGTKSSVKIEAIGALDAMYNTFDTLELYAFMCGNFYTLDPQFIFLLRQSDKYRDLFKAIPICWRTDSSIWI